MFASQIMAATVSDTIKNSASNSIVIIDQALSYYIYKGNTSDKLYLTIDELTHTATTQESFGLSNVENGGYSIWGKQFIYFGETGQFTILIGSDNNVYLTSVGDGRALNLLGVKQ